MGGEAVERIDEASYSIRAMSGRGVFRRQGSVDVRAVSAAAAACAVADAIVVAAGAGLGVDSGLPDFRGPEGFWRAYPPMRALGLAFSDMANPRWFERDPALAWGFYGQRLALYRRTRPHEGFAALAALGARARAGAFVVTSNVDGQFQRAAFGDASVLEVHGSIHHLQCSRGCGEPLRSADGVDVLVDEATMRAQPPLPICTACGAVARPAILMFGDAAWDASRTHAQELRFARWLADARPQRLVVLEVGAGDQVATIRRFSERLVAASEGATLVRVNPRDHAVPSGHVSIAAGARDALLALANELGVSIPAR